MNAGKGDKIRPYNRKLWDAGWDRAFGGKDDDLERIDGTVEIDTPKAPKGNNKRRLGTPGKSFRSSQTPERHYNISGMARRTRGTNDD